MIVNEFQAAICTVIGFFLFIMLTTNLYLGTGTESFRLFIAFIAGLVLSRSVFLAGIDK